MLSKEASKRLPRAHTYLQISFHSRAPRTLYEKLFSLSTLGLDLSCKKSEGMKSKDTPFTEPINREIQVHVESIDSQPLRIGGS